MVLMHTICNATFPNCHTPDLIWVCMPLNEKQVTTLKSRPLNLSFGRIYLLDIIKAKLASVHVCNSQIRNFNRKPRPLGRHLQAALNRSNGSYRIAIECNIAKHVVEDRLREGVELVEELTTLGADRVSLIENPSNPLLLIDRQNRYTQTLQKSRRNPPLTCTSCHSQFAGRADRRLPKEMQQIAFVQLETRTNHLELSGADPDLMLQPSLTDLSIFPARSDLRSEHIAVPEDRVSLGHFGKQPGLQGFR